MTVRLRVFVLVPVLSAINGRGLFLTPDDWLERLTVATGADGVATLPYLPATIDPLTVRVTAPGIVPHDFPLPDRPGSDRFTLKLGRPARLAGSVYQRLGPAGGERPGRGLGGEYVLSTGRIRTRTGRRRAWPALIHFDSGPIRTGADGSFLTPPQLMTGSSYRIIIRPEGDPLVTSDWLTATTELTTVPPLRLQAAPQTGRARPRSPRSTGRRCAGLSPLGRAVDHDGCPGPLPAGRNRFPTRPTCWSRPRASGFQGWPGVPAREPQERKLILVRTSEPPDRTMAPLPAPISVEESRALARRVLEPYLQAALEKGDDNPKWDCLRIVSKIDPAPGARTAREASLPGSRCRRQHPEQGRHASCWPPIPWRPNRSSTRSRARRIARWAYVWLAEALPDAERDRKREFLERATVQVHAPPVAGDGADPRSRLVELARVAGALAESRRGREGPPADP